MPTIDGVETKVFTVDEANSDDQYLYVDVFGRGTVVIKAEDDGLVVDIFPFHVVDEPVASTWAHMSDLIAEDSNGCPWPWSEMGELVE